jgi:hypothetical protein
MIEHERCPAWPARSLQRLTARAIVVPVETASTAPGRGYLLDPHDCVVSKLVAGREKDYLFAALIDAGGSIRAYSPSGPKR